MHDSGPGRMLLGAVHDTSAESMLPFVEAIAEACATAETDDRYSGSNERTGCVTVKNKIIIAITKSTPWGGAQKYVHDLAINLPKEKFDICVVLGGKGELYERLISAGIRTIAITTMQRDLKFFSDIASAIQLYRILSREKPDILHVNSSKAGVLGSVLGRLCGITNVIFTAHGWAFNEVSSCYTKHIFRFLHTLTLACAHKTIAVSHKVREEAPVSARNRSRIRVIHNGIDDTVYLSKADARRKLAEHSNILKYLLECDANRLIIGTIAELHPRKGHFDALDAYASIRPLSPGSVFVIVGDGELRARLEAEIKQRCLDSSVVLLGHVPEAASIVSAFDIFVLPSHSEPLGYVVCEAGRASVPVVATQVGGIPEIISDERFGILVPPRSPHKLARALARLIKNDSVRQQLGSSLACRVREEFSFQRMIEGMIEAYQGEQPRAADGSCHASGAPAQAGEITGWRWSPEAHPPRDRARARCRETTSAAPSPVPQPFNEFMNRGGCCSSRVALLIPAYNCQADLNATVVRLPTEEPLHILIVDDGSTPPLVAPPSDPIHSVEVLRNPQNLKIHGALRRGMEVLHARGFRYVARLDAGDFALPGRFQSQRAFLETHPGVALVGSWIELFAVPGGLGTVRLPESDAVIRRFKLLKVTFSHPAVMMRSDAVLAVGNYRDSHPCAEDLDLFLRLIERYEVANLPQVLTRKIEHAACITNQRRQQMILSTLRLQADYLRLAHWADWAGLLKSILQLVMPRRAFQRMKLWVVQRPNAAHGVR